MGNQENKEIYFPFDSVQNELGEDDRVYFSADFAKYFSNFIGNGIYPNPSDNLKVVENNGLSLIIKSGSGFINGYGYVLKEDMPITINKADASYTRKDIIVLKLDLVNRNITLQLKTGTPSNSPVAPDIVRNSDIYELKLAEITIKANTQNITNADILDTRFDNSVCGVVTNVVKSVDTTELFNQYESYLNKKILEWEKTKDKQNEDWQLQMSEQENEFNTKKSEIQTWYDDIKNNINIIKDFDFDNLANLNNVVRETTKNSTQIIEVIKFEPNQKNIAKRTTTINRNEITINLIVYEEDGETEKLNKNIVTTIIDGKIIERVD